MTQTNLDILCGNRGLAAAGQAPFPGAGSRTGVGLYLSDGGRARLAHIQGYLGGLTQAGQGAYAERLAEDLLGKLRYLNGYGGEEETPWGVLPRFRIVMGSDTSPLGFGLSWLRRDEEPGLDASDAAMDEHYNFYRFDRWKDGVEHSFYWRRWITGGLLYHGPGGEPNAVDLGAAMGQETFWSVHT